MTWTYDKIEQSIDVVIHVGGAGDCKRQVIEICESDPAAVGVQLLLRFGVA